LGLFAELPLHVDDNMLSKLEGQLRQIETDFDVQSKQRLIQVIIEIEKSETLPVDDNYAVSVRLKDDSIYAYAPRSSLPTYNNVTAKHKF